MKKRALILTLDPEIYAKWEAYARVMGHLDIKAFAYRAITAYIAKEAPQGARKAEYEKILADSLNAQRR